MTLRELFNVTTQLTFFDIKVQFYNNSHERMFFGQYSEAKELIFNSQYQDATITFLAIDQTHKNMLIIDCIV